MVMPKPPSPDTVSALLSFDSLAAAEKVTGQSYKDDPETLMLGFGMQMLAGKAKNDALKQMGDTYMSMPWLDFLAVTGAAGFGEVFTREFRDTERPSSVPETFVVLWHPAGLLLKAESYGADRVNTAVLHFNWRANDRANPWGEGAAYLGISGGLKEDGDGGYVLVGHKDVRDGLRHFIHRCEQVGAWLSPWVERPFLWLLDYTQSKVPGYDYRAISEGVIEALPEHVRNAVTPGVQ